MKCRLATWGQGSGLRWFYQGGDVQSGLIECTSKYVVLHECSFSLLHFTSAPFSLLSLSLPCLFSTQLFNKYLHFYYIFGPLGLCND